MLTIILSIFGACMLLYLLFFAIAMSIGTQTIPDGHAGVRTGWGGLSIGLGITMGGSLFLNKIRFLDLEHQYTFQWKANITTADQQPCIVHYDSTWNITPDETSIQTLLRQTGARKADQQEKLQRYFNQQLNKTITQLSKTATAQEWQQQVTILAALRQKGQQLGLQVQEEQLTIKT